MLADPLRMDGIDAPLATEIRRALAIAGVDGRLHVSGASLAYADEPRRVTDRSENEVHVRILWEDDHIWLLSGNSCPACLRAWRSNRWRAGLTAPEGRAPGRQPSPPAMTTLIATLIVHRAGEAQREYPPARLIRPAARLVSDHPVLAYPGCPRCGLQDAGPQDTGPEHNRDHAAALFDPLSAHACGYRARNLDDIGQDLAPLMVDERCGLVRQVTRHGGGSIMPMTQARLFPFEPTIVEHGYGRGGSDADNATVALLEALERYAAIRPPAGTALVRGRYADLTDRAIDPAAFILPTVPQDGAEGSLNAYAPDRLYDWVWGYSFGRRGPVLVPAQFAFNAGVRPGERIVQETSSGCAAGSSIVEAAFHGLLEVIERDAFLVHWYGRWPVRQVDPAGCEDVAVRSILARLTAEDLRVEVFDIGAGPAAAAIAVRVVDLVEGRGPACAFAAGAHVDPVAALRGALVEVATSLRCSWSVGDVDSHVARGRTLLDDPSSVRTIADHVVQCWPPEAIERLRFAVAADPPVDWSTFARRAPGGAGSSDVRQALDRLVASSLAWCTDVIVVDQSIAPIAARSVYCVKMLAPGLLPMTFGHGNRRVAPRRWGRQEAGDIVPHPFP